MCFNKETSMVVFLFGVVCSVKLYMNSFNHNNSKRERFISASILLFFISAMQLIEYIIWKYQPIYKNCKQWLANKDDLLSQFTQEELFPK
jgi:hypothetical protein